jgi:hypothetical protein
MEDAVDGNTDDYGPKTKQLKLANKWQLTSKWFSDSISPSHHKHHEASLVGTIPLHTRFALVGNRLSSSCHEKTITFDGAQLLHTCATTPLDSSSKVDDGRIFLYKYKCYSYENWFCHSKKVSGATYYLFVFHSYMITLFWLIY